MKNLTFSIDTVKNTVTFTFIYNTLKYSETCYLTKWMDYQKMIDNCVRMEIDLRIIISEGKKCFLESFIFYRDDNLPLISIFRNKGVVLSETDKEIILDNIKLTIQEQKTFTELSIFEIRVNDLDFFEYTYFIDELEITNLYQYQIHHKQYFRV